MPHVTIEYTKNLRDSAAIPALLQKINATLIAQDGVFPLGGIRSRAIELADYCVADGKDDYAFVHASFRIGAGRSDAVKRAACEALFATIKDHFAALFAERPLALSMDFAETDEAWSFKHNNLHALLKKRAGA